MVPLIVVLDGDSGVLFGEFGLSLPLEAFAPLGGEDGGGDLLFQFGFGGVFGFVELRGEKVLSGFLVGG